MVIGGAPLPRLTMKAVYSALHVVGIDALNMSFTGVVIYFIVYEYGPAWLGCVSVNTVGECGFTRVKMGKVEELK